MTAKLRANLVGKRFDKLKVVSLKEVVPKIGALWNCLCDCGHSHVASTTNLRRKKSQHCRECARAVRAKQLAIARSLKKNQSKRAVNRLFHSLSDNEQKEVIQMMRRRKQAGHQKLRECIQAVRPSLI